MGNRGNPNWRPGVSGNPLGRPKNPETILKESIRELIGKCTLNGLELVEAEISIARGEPQAVPQHVRMPDGTYEEIEGAPKILIPELSERNAARRHLMDRYFGKTPEKVEMTGSEGQSLFDPRTMPVEVLEAYSIAIKTLIERAQAVTVDGEVVENAVLAPGTTKSE